MFLAVDWALMTDIIPRASAGRYMGLTNVATGSAPLFAVAIGGLVLDAVTTASAVTRPGRARRSSLGVVLFAHRGDPAAAGGRASTRRRRDLREAA